MFKKRILSLLITIFSVGVILAASSESLDTSSMLHLYVGLVIAVALALIFRYVFKVKYSKQITATAFAVVALLCGLLRVIAYDNSLTEYEAFDSEVDTATLYVYEINSNYIEAKLCSGSIGVPENTKVRLYPDCEVEGLEYGDYIVANLKYHSTDKTVHLSQGIRLTASCEITEVEDGDGFVRSVRKYICETADRLYSDFDYAPTVVKGVVIGDRSDMDGYFFSMYKSAGLSHVLAISGLHISLISMGLYSILKLLRVHLNLCRLLSALVAISYAAVVGFPAGAFRSAVMMSVLLLSGIFFRSSDSITTLFLTLFCILLTNPYALFSQGLQLSFACTLGIVLAGPYLDSMSSFFIFKRNLRNDQRKNILLEIIPPLIAPFIISIVSTVFSLPIIFFSFDTVSYVSLIGNILAVPLFNVAVGLTFIVILVSLISIPVASFLAVPAGILFETVTRFAEYTYSADVGSVSVHAKFMFIPVVLSGVIILLMVSLSAKNFYPTLIALSLFIASFAFAVVYNNYEINNRTVLEYGYDDSEYFYVASKGENLYVDLGGWTSYPDVIFKNSETALDEYIINHYDTYTYKRLEYLSGSVKIKRILLPEPINSEDYHKFLQIKELARRRNCDIMTIDDVISQSVGEFVDLQVYKSYGSLLDGDLICADVDGLKVRLLGKDFDNSVVCDIALACSSYGGSADKIVSSHSYASSRYMSRNESSQRYFTEFKDRLSIVFYDGVDGYILNEH